MSFSNTQGPRRREVLLGLSALTFTGGLNAQPSTDYPRRAVRIVVPYAPGGSTDMVARLLADKLGAQFKQPFVVENKPGANGIVGADLVSRADPDGHTLLFPAGSVLALSPLLYKANFDPVKSFVPISMVSSWPLLLTVNPTLPANSLKELIELAQSGKRPLSLAAGTSGYALLGEQLKLLMRAKDMLIVPYSGSGPQMQAVVGGQADMMIDTLASLPMVRSGKLRAIGLVSDRRTPSLPDVPTFPELGVDMTYKGYAGIFAPAGTPAPIVNQLQDAVIAITKMPDIREKFASVDFDPVGNTSAEFAEAVRLDIERYRRMVNDTNFKVG